MREIKFRAWDGIRMVYSDRMLASEGNELREFFFLIDKGVELMQYTGLKDKNGKEIYEGDIISSLNYILGEVVFDECVFESYYCVLGWTIKQQKFNDFSFYQEYIKKSEHEVCGNIYENPELLKSK